MTDLTYEEEIEEFIRDVFEKNYEELRLDSGHAIAPDVKKTALQQVLLYWRKLRNVAENVTDTEVRLSLPGQETPRGQGFTIEGIVDILRENDRTIMYDIKTHDADYVRANIDLYEKQLNIYAHIWRQLRQQSLDSTAIVATDFPEPVKQALGIEDDDALLYALSKWEPVVPIDFDFRRVEDTIQEFGEVVDAIESGDFSPPPVGRLQEIVPGQHRTRFGTHVCRNCDARFSCESYRAYASQTRQVADRGMMQYFPEAITNSEQENWRSASLDDPPTADELMKDFTTRRRDNG